MSRRIVLFLVLTSIGATAGAAEPTYFDSDGVRIRYVDEGLRDGEPVVLVHGFTADISMQWAGPGVIRALKDDYRVIALDNRGHGKSEKPHEPEKYGLEMVRDVTRLMDYLEIKQAHVVGYSMGGFITCKLLTLHPERLITATLGGAGWPRDDEPRQAMLTELVESLESGNGIGPLLKGLTPPGKPVPSDDQLKGMSQLAMLINDPLALAAALRGRKELTVPEADLKKNRLPVLALIGAEDPLKTGVDELVGVLPELEVVVIPSADHMNAFGKAEFKAHLRRFLDAHRQSPKPVPAAAKVGVGAGN